MHSTTNDARLTLRLGLAIAAGVLVSACGTEATTVPSALSAVSAARVASDAFKPNFNLEVILRAPDGADGFGHVKFRQANDDATIVDLGVWVRDLAPNTHYKLQRAVDTVLDDECTSTTWLTLGKGAVPDDIVTDDSGTAKEDLFRVLTTPGNAFDIHFRLITTATPPAVVLTSECYQFFVR
jgi:hypothetical protein